ncbi:Card1-like endonuclease domain-containing protein [Runella sp.]|uniref:Card1-like endonuclease domain-containing protein n=1 Tax=Runella sp. TaxID=1960881 RepID=UPI0026390CBC|nr:DUF1887 family CARF protein [Runella sp.]
MAQYLVSIVGRQTLPNILPIKEYAGLINQHIFISTSKVSEELSWIKTVCAIGKDDFFNLEIDEDDIGQIVANLTALSAIFTQEDEFYINLTGGTKIMALGTFQFFSQSPFKVKMFYLNMGSNVLRQVYPPIDASLRDEPLLYRINVADFLGSYGATITNSSSIFKMTKSKEYTALFFEYEWSKEPIIRKIREERYNIIFDRIDAVYRRELRAFLSKIDFSLTFEDRITKEEIQYLTGGWWEEYCFYFIKEKIGIQEPFIAKGLVNNKTNNELDVAFVKDNVLHVLECKTTIFNKEDFEDYVYKLAAIKDNKNGFGISVKAYLFTNLIKRDQQANTIDETFQRRASAFNITLVDSLVFQRDDFKI